MSRISSTLIILAIFVRRSNQLYSKDNADVLCSSQNLDTYGGKINVKFSKQFRVQCDKGYVTPWSSPNQSYIYECDNGVLNRKIPEGCVVKRLAYRKMRFQVLLAQTEKTAGLCQDVNKQAELAKRYNETVEKPGQRLQNKLYITNCSVPTNPNDYVRVHAVATKLLKRNVTSDVAHGGTSHVVVQVFRLLVDCMEDLEYLTVSQAKNATLIYNPRKSVIGYHCDDHLQMRRDSGEYVCVGCGKGFWMGKNKTCHPCGPGYYNPEETAVKCQPCPVQYEEGLWSADGIISRFLDGLIVPVTYLLILIVVVTVLQRHRGVPSLETKLSRQESSVRFSSTFQPQ